MTRSVGVVVPAYRPEVSVLTDYVTALHDRLAPAAIRIELDAPAPGVEERLADLPATLSVSSRRRGKGAAITAGFEALETDILAFADGDGSTPAESLASIIDPVETGAADLAVGSRRHPEATVTSHQTHARRWLGHVFARVARGLLDVRLYDYQCGAKALTGEAWAAVREHLYETGFAWDLELIAMAGAVGLTIREVPIVWEDRPKSTVSPVRTSIALGRALIMVRHRARLLQDDPLHESIQRYRTTRSPIIDAANRDDE